jgi:hypothetical protein
VEEEMNKQLALQLRNKEQLVTVWGRLAEPSREALGRLLASLIAAAAQAEAGPAGKESGDEPDVH